VENLRKIFRRLRTLLWTALTIVTVLAAVLVGIGKLLMPYSDHYQPRLESWLSEAFNQPVSVESFEGEWKAFGPRISLQGVTFVPEGMQSEIALQQAALDIKPLNALIPGRPLYSFRIIGADLSLERTADGRYLLSGLGVNSSTSAGSNPTLRSVALNGEVRLENSTFSFDDPEREIHIVLTDLNGRLSMDGDHVAVEIQSRISDRDRQRVFGDLEAIVQVTLDEEQHLADAAWHLKTGELMLDELLKQLPHHSLLPVSGWLNAELWGNWQQGQPQKMQGVVDLRDARLSSPTGRMVIDHLNSRFNWQFNHARDWRIDLSDMNVEAGGLAWQTPRLSVARNLPQDLGLWVSADFLRLDFPLQLTQRILASYNTVWPAAIPRRAQGSLTDIDLLLDAKWQLRKAQGRLENGRFWDWENGPEISGINAEVALESDGGDISFGGPEFKLEWLRVFRRQLALELSDCRLEVLLAPEKVWQLDLNYCHLQNKDISGYGRIRMASGEGKPEVDISAVMEHGDMAGFGDYWPENVMSESVLHWLRTSLLGGEVSGRFSMVGDLDDFPFKNQRGRMQAVATLSDVNVRYVDGWPQVRQADAAVEFLGVGMYAEGRIGNTAGAVVDHVVVHIPDFQKPVLDVEYRSSADLAGIIGFIKQTPLLDDIDLDPEQFMLTGSTEISGRVLTGLGVASQPLQVTGAVELQDAYFKDMVSEVELRSVNGTLNYASEGLDGTQIAADFRNYPVLLDINADWDAPEVFRASLHGDLPADRVIPDDLMQREPLLRRLVGISPWDITLSIASVDGLEDRDIWLELYSGLQGTVLDCPAPLNKPIDDSWPLLVRYPVRSDVNTVTAHLPGRGHLKMELEPETTSPLRAVFHLGGGTGELPEEGRFTLSGTAELVDLDGWLDLIIERFQQTADDEGGLEMQSAVLVGAQIRLFDRLFDNVSLQMVYEDEVLNGSFDGEDILGKVRFYRNKLGTSSLTAEFERLLMPEPVSMGVQMETNPAEMPEMHFYSKEFSYLGINWGETRIEGYPIKNGFHLDSVDARSAQLELGASGDWVRGEQGDRSDFNIRISSESLGAVLEAMDISSAMQGGQTVVNFDAWWNGPPAAFALERLNGEMDLDITQGNILTADPGAGRLLGLLSLSELPRRLAMDFRDVFDEGFSFDEANGTMQLENGNSYTDDLTLSSTAATITIVGSTDLVEQTFDYEFIVRPGVSKALPVIGAIAGGPVGAAAGLALQALLRDSLGEAAEARYTIRGPWEDAEVEPVEKKSAKKSTGSKETDTGLQEVPEAVIIKEQLPEPLTTGNDGNG